MEKKIIAESKTGSDTQKESFRARLNKTKYELDRRNAHLKPKTDPLIPDKKIASVK